MRTLKANEIECRVGTLKANGCSLLLYKDARVDMKILDEVFGNDNWQRTHEVINGNLFCNIEIWDDTKKCWVKKQDVGTESFTEKEKGEASDSFKRAGFNVGIGRELYTSPFIWITLNEKEVEIKNDKTTLKSSIKFWVAEIGYDKENNINHLIIKDNKNKTRFELLSEEKSKEKLKLIATIKSKITDGKLDVEDLKDTYQVEKLSDLCTDQLKEILGEK